MQDVEKRKIHVYVGTDKLELCTSYTIFLYRQIYSKEGQSISEKINIKSDK
jgi:hypothetical protein